MRQVVCEACGMEMMTGVTVCARCGAPAAHSHADRMAPSPFGPPIARWRATEFGPPALAAAHDALQPETRMRVPAWQAVRDEESGR